MPDFSLGEKLRVTLFGQSHSPAVGMTTGLSFSAYEYHILQASGTKKARICSYFLCSVY